MEWLQDILNFIWVAMAATVGFIMKKINKNAEDIVELKKESVRHKVYAENFHEDITELKTEISKLREVIQQLIRQNGPR